MNFFSSLIRTHNTQLTVSATALQLNSVAQLKKAKGFTLIELMIVVVVVAILAAIAIPSYSQYIERKDLAIARQEALRLAGELERFKSKNFSYKGFDATYLYGYQGTDSDGNSTSESYYDKATGKLSLPLGASGSDVKYIITLVDGGTRHKPLTIEKNSEGAETTDSESVNGLSWAISVERVKDGTEPKQPRNYDLLLTNAGLRCMTKVKNVVSTFVSCGDDDNSESW
ncbi:MULTISPECIES: prepilin-type N-terminal cleavage/methylation domain-containing protein [unclassified Acinetobacter]|uniref:type IV pilin protein n=1 Tax=unclassified Acinetobacter TaxID=196816 RepID=UPI0015D3F9AA|nr:prepilin-type N-terminal cleavage/methylation domain-containing protein [Candidatus Acinetobacter avistercoris]